MSFCDRIPPRKKENFMKNFELTLLSDDQVWGSEEEKQLDVLKSYGTSALITDLTALTGILYYDDIVYTELFNNHKIKGSYWTKSVNNNERKGIVTCSKNGDKLATSESYRDRGIRPVLKSNKVFNEVYSKRKLGENNAYEVEYGEYPQTLADEKEQIKLEKIYLLEQLKKAEYRTKMKKTGKVYTFDSLPASPQNWKRKMEPISYDEFSYKNQKYIRIWENCDRYLWVKVEPITWLIDEETKSLVSKKILLSGIRFAPESSENIDFEKTDMKYYLDNFMAYEILSQESLEYINKRLKEINKELSELESLKEKLLKEQNGKKLIQK